MLRSGLLGFVMAVALTLSANAAEESKTLTGEGKCAKCALKEAKSCQNALQVKDGEKTVTYYLTQNDVSKKFHENICSGPKKITVTGTVKEVDGKKELTPTKIELVKQSS